VSCRACFIVFRSALSRNALSHRDFAYERSDCFKSLTARAINELFRSHAFVLAVNFHAGITLLGWPWGDSRHCNGGSSVADSPCQGGGWDTADGKAMRGIGERLASIAGGVAATAGGAPVPLYKTGTINEVGIVILIDTARCSPPGAGYLQRTRRH
jgi:hypothetical protein